MLVHIYHYNINAEQRFFLGNVHRPLFDLIALNGNIVSHTPKGVAGFVATTNKPFYVDPQTHAFQHATINLKRDVREKETDAKPDYQWKPSVLRLAKERLKSVFGKVIDYDRPLNPAMFKDDKSAINQQVVEQVCESVLDFQRNILASSLSEEDREFMDPVQNFCPHFLLSPYFYLSSKDYSDWLKINVECYTKTKSLSDGVPVYLPVVISKQFMELRRSILIEAISQLKPDGILLWIDDHIEEGLGTSQVGEFVQFLRELQNHTGNVLNSHGGYLSTLLCHSDCGPLLSGVGHSVNYGESRSVIPVGGGLPMARFYFPSIHSRLKYTDALDIVRAKSWLSNRQNYEQHVCQCEQCTDLLNEHPNIDRAFYVYGKSRPITFERRSRSGGRQLVRLDYPTAEAKLAAARHYLFRKNAEFTTINSASFVELVNRLKSTYDEIATDCDDHSFVHLEIWHRGLTGLCSET